MKITTKCKFCNCDLLLTIDDDFVRTSDWKAMVALAACNRCADLRERKRALEESIKDICGEMVSEGPKAREEWRDTLTKLTQSYSVLVARWFNMEGMLWDKEFVNLFIEQPQKYGSIISNYWRHFRASQGIK